MQGPVRGRGKAEAHQEQLWIAMRKVIMAKARPDSLHGCPALANAFFGLLGTNEERGRRAKPRWRSPADGGVNWRAED